MGATACLSRILLLGTLAAWALLGSVAPGAAALSQSFTLQPGWNAVFLQVQPEPRDPASVFAGLPIDSVWTWSPRLSTVDFIQDLDEAMWNQPGWLVHFPASRADAHLSNLFAMQGNRAYLIKVSGSSPIAWTVTGAAVPPRIEWLPDSYNLVGFPVDPDSSPEFGSYLAASPAHAGQAVYQLNPSGSWERLPPAGNTPIQAGRAYWVFCAGNSGFIGPLEVQWDQFAGLDFGSSLDEQAVRIRSLSGQPAEVSIQALQDPASPLRYRNPNPAAADPWLQLPLSFTTTGTAQTHLRLGIQRASFADGAYAGTLEVKDGNGMRVLLPVSASAPRHNSLWIGTVTIEAVGEVSGDAGSPTPTASEFQFRLILHVDQSGQARLLKEVIQLWEDGTYRPSPDDPAVLVEDQPGRFVLVTDDELIPQFKGVSLRDGELVGRRVSSAAIDFEGNELPMNGAFGQTLTCEIALPPEFPTHPLRHKYHPDHDNLDAQYRNFQEEAPSITRAVALEFSATDPNGAAPPGWGYSVVGGTYRETLSGLHKKDIAVAGTFRLELASFVDTLNQ